MLSTHNQLRSKFETQLLAAMHFAHFVGKTMYIRNEHGRYQEKWVEDRWLGYLLARDTKD